MVLMVKRALRILPVPYVCALCNRRHGRWTRIGEAHVRAAKVTLIRNLQEGPE